MAFWVVLWKVVLLATVGIYGVMAVWVTIQGARDIKSMMADIRQRHEAGKAAGGLDRGRRRWGWR